MLRVNQVARQHINRLRTPTSVSGIVNEHIGIVGDDGGVGVDSTALQRAVVSATTLYISTTYRQPPWCLSQRCIHTSQQKLIVMHKRADSARCCTSTVVPCLYTGLRFLSVTWINGIVHTRAQT